MTSTTWASPRYVQELATILGPQNRIQGSCAIYDLGINIKIEELSLSPWIIVN